MSISEDDDGIDLSRYSGKDRVYMEAVKNGNMDEVAWMNEDADFYDADEMTEGETRRPSSVACGDTFPRGGRLRRAGCPRYGGRRAGCLRYR